MSKKDLELQDLLILVVVIGVELVKGNILKKAHAAPKALMARWFILK